MGIHFQSFRASNCSFSYSSAQENLSRKNVYELTKGWFLHIVVVCGCVCVGVCVGGYRIS